MKRDSAAGGGEPTAEAELLEVSLELRAESSGVLLEEGTSVGDVVGDFDGENVAPF